MAAAWRPRSAWITPNLPPGPPRSILECALAPRHERAPGETQYQQRYRVYREHDLQRAPRTHLDRLAFRLVEVHHLHHAQVVERADHLEHDADDVQPQHVALDRRAQHRQLGPEPQERRYPGHRSHDAQHKPRHPWAAGIQALEVVDAVGLEAVARDRKSTRLNSRH